MVCRKLSFIHLKLINLKPSLRISLNVWNLEKFLIVFVEFRVWSLLNFYGNLRKTNSKSQTFTSSLGERVIRGFNECLFCVRNETKFHCLWHKRSVKPFSNASRITNVKPFFICCCYRWMKKGRKQKFMKMVNNGRKINVYIWILIWDHDKKRLESEKGFTKGRSADNIKSHRLAPFEPSNLVEVNRALVVNHK